MDYIKDLYDNITSNLLTGSFAINATIYIKGDNVNFDSTYSGIGDSLDGRYDSHIAKNFPSDLPKFIRIQVFPMERMYTQRHGTPIVHTFAGQFEPYDRWISCLEADVKIGDHDNYYQHSDYVSVDGVKYKVKAVHREAFGIKPLLHAFLVKESNE